MKNIGNNKMSPSNVTTVLVYSIFLLVISACTSERTCEDIRAEHHKEINVPGLNLNQVLEASLKYRTEYKESGCPGKL